MEDHRKYLESIDAYLLGELEGDTLYAFKQAMTKDPDLMEEIRVRKLILEGVKTAGNRALKKRIARLTSRKHLPWVWVLVILALLTSLVVWFYPRHQSTDSEALIALYYSPYTWESGIRSPEENQMLFNARQKYVEEKYSEAIPLLEKSISEKESDNLRLALACSYLETKEPEKAIFVLEKITSQLYRDHAKWYFILANLQMNEIAQVKELIKEFIKSPEADHYTEALQLLKSLQ